MLQVGVFLNVGLDGLGEDEYIETYEELEILKFKYLYVGLPALDGWQYLELANPAALAFCPLMKVPPDQLAEFKARWYEQLANLEVNDYQKYLLIDCAEAYIHLDADQEKEFRELLKHQPFEKARVAVDGILERYVEGVEDGREAARREFLRIQLEKKFGPLASDVHQQLEDWPQDQLMELAANVLTADSLAELGFRDSSNGDR